MKRIYFLCLVALIGFSGCDDDDDYEIWTRSDYLMANGCWYIEQAIVTANINGEQFSGNVSQYLPACIEDNSISFHPDGTIVINDRLIKCNESDPQEINAGVNWALTDYDTKLSAMIPGLTENIQFEVLELDGKYLRIRWSDMYEHKVALFVALFSHSQ